MAKFKVGLDPVISQFSKKQMIVDEIFDLWRRGHYRCLMPNNVGAYNVASTVKR